MSDFKSKLPDLKELGQMTGKLLKDIKKSVDEIIETYKQNRPTEPARPKTAEKETPVKKAKVTAAKPEGKESADASKEEKE